MLNQFKERSKVGLVPAFKETTHQQFLTKFNMQFINFKLLKLKDARICKFYNTTMYFVCLPVAVSGPGGVMV